MKTEEDYIEELVQTVKSEEEVSVFVGVFFGSYLVTGVCVHVCCTVHCIQLCTLVTCAYHIFLIYACESVGCTCVICCVILCFSKLLVTFPLPSTAAAIMLGGVRIDVIL